LNKYIAYGFRMGEEAKEIPEITPVLVEIKRGALRRDVNTAHK
jgi:hypothetical protein